MSLWCPRCGERAVRVLVADRALGPESWCSIRQVGFGSDGYRNYVHE